jgi:RNA recognition motif-containing protein
VYSCTDDGSLNYIKGERMQIYVGNLPVEYEDDDLRSLFEPYGKVRAANVGQEKGYGFVEMPVKSEGRAAIEALRGRDMQGKPLRVKAIKPGDEFERQFHSLRGNKGPKGVPTFRGDIGHRASGAIRRGGKRGA